MFTFVNNMHPLETLRLHMMHTCALRDLASCRRCADGAFVCSRRVCVLQRVTASLRLTGIIFCRRCGQDGPIR
jgi:hypothetical protein